MKNIDPLDAMAESERKAWDSLARYKFLMFGYHAAQWVLLNRIDGGKNANPFKRLVELARKHQKNPGEDLPNDIWQQLEVKQALKEGRPADDIAVLSCPDCGRWGYYNQGSGFSCRFCNKSWLCLAEGEWQPDGVACIRLEEEGFTTLADTVTETTDGYHNETVSEGA